MSIHCLSELIGHQEIYSLKTKENALLRLLTNYFRDDFKFPNFYEVL